MCASIDLVQADRSLIRFRLDIDITFSGQTSDGTALCPLKSNVFNISPGKVMDQHYI